MDYSNDPAGADPWASSPQHNRGTFAQPPTSDIPSSPLSPQASPYAQQNEQYGYIGGHDENNRPNTASDGGDNAHQSPAPHQPSSPQQQQQAPAHGQPGTQQHQQPQRYHGTRGQAQRSPPQAKLQCKITMLERTGRKDPILRFDVHVCGYITTPLTLGKRY